MATFEVTELDTFTPSYPEESWSLEWDTCADLSIPDLHCSDFPSQCIGVNEPRVNASTGEPVYEELPGQCVPTGEMHPSEVEWTEEDLTNLKCPEDSVIINMIAAVPKQGIFAA